MLMFFLSGIEIFRKKCLTLQRLASLVGQQDAFYKRKAFTKRYLLASNLVKLKLTGR